MEGCDLDEHMGELTTPSFLNDDFQSDCWQPLRQHDDVQHRTLPVPLIARHATPGVKDRNTVVRSLTQGVLQELGRFGEFVISSELPDWRRFYEIMGVLEWMGLVEKVRLNVPRWQTEQSDGSQGLGRTVYRLIHSS
jgi:hypothetical protein